MELWIGLIGALGGAIVAIVGQQLNVRSEVREANRIRLLDNCVELIALSEDYRNRVWEERRLKQGTPVADWDLPAYRRAEATIEILAADGRLISASQKLRHSGSELGKHWRMQGQVDPEATTERLWSEHRAALDDFVAATKQSS